VSFPLALGKYQLAAKRSHPSKLALTRPATSHPLIRARLGNPANSSGLQPFLPERLDQGQSGSCTAHSFAGGVATRCAFAKVAPSFVPSPLEIYATTRAVERAVATSVGALPPLTDSGAELADVILSVSTFGVAPIKAPTPDGRNSDIWTSADTAAQPPNVNNDPVAMDLESAAPDVLAGAYTIDLTAPSAVQTAVAALSSGLPLYCGFFVDTAFGQLQAGQIAKAPNTNDPNGGGHAIFLADFRPSASAPGTTEMLLVNSWGAGWCDNGTVWVSQAWFLAAWEAWPLSEELIAS